MAAHAGGFLGEISDRPYDESSLPGTDYSNEFGPRPSDEGQRDPDEGAKSTRDLTPSLTPD
jgi:hypothetical protein